LNWLAARLQEPSTWRGLVWLATACGLVLSPEAWQYITTAGMALAGLVGVLTTEKAQRVEIQLPPVELVGAAERRVPTAHVQAPSSSPTDGPIERPAAALPEDVFHDSFGDK
jgi:hypothetical protein